MTRQKAPGIRRAHRLPLVQHRGVSVEERPVDDVRMAHRPAEVGRGPVDLAGLDAVEVAHAPGERDEVAAVVAHDALGIAGGARGVEDVERIGGRERDAVHRRRAGRELGPVVIPARHQRRPRLGPLEHDAALGLGRGELDGAVEQRLVGHHPVDLDPAGRASGSPWAAHR